MYLCVSSQISARLCISERSVQSLYGRFIPSSHHYSLLRGIPPSPIVQSLVLFLREIVSMTFFSLLRALSEVTSLLYCSFRSTAVVSKKMPNVMSREVCCSDISDGLWFVAGRGTMTINYQERKQPCRPPPHGHPIDTKSNQHHHECLGYGRRCLRRRFSHQGGHHHRRGRAQVSGRPEEPTCHLLTVG